MPYPLDLKKKGSLLLLAITCVVILIEVNTSKESGIKYWTPDSTLYVHDFMKSPSFIDFNGFSAQIRTGIQVQYEKDSIPIAKAFIQKHLSFYKKSHHSDRLLNHEAYHANITAIGADKLNYYLTNIEYLSETSIKKLTKSVIFEMKGLDNRYDSETAHSTNVDMQRYWEYKIDSMYNSNKNLIVKDNFSGASAYFPSSPTKTIIKDTFLLGKTYILNKYDMEFRLSVYFDFYVNPNTYRNLYTNMLGRNSFTSIETKDYTINKAYHLSASYLDTLKNIKVFDSLIFKNGYLFSLMTSYPNNIESEEPYLQMKKTFLQSFRYFKNEEYWHSFAYNNNEFSAGKLIYRSEITPSENDKIISYKSLSVSDNSIFYHPPFIANKSLIFPFESVRHSPNDLLNLIVVVNDNTMLSFKPDSTSKTQVILLDTKELKKGNNEIRYGYFTKSDSTNEFPHLYSTIVNFDYHL